MSFIPLQLVRSCFILLSPLTKSTCMRWIHEIIIFNRVITNVIERVKPLGEVEVLERYTTRYSREGWVYKKKKIAINSNVYIEKNFFFFVLSLFIIFPRIIFIYIINLKFLITQYRDKCLSLKLEYKIFITNLYFICNKFMYVARQVYLIYTIYLYIIKRKHVTTERYLDAW